MGQFFEAKKRIFPQKAKGKFRKIKSVLNLVFLTIYFFSPFLRFDRGGNAPNQAILIDLPNSKAYFFFIEIWPKEVFYLAGILIIAAVALFFVTSLFGRIWCGYACFQTVWTDIFIALERFFQGDRNERIILDRKNSFKKFYKKSLTHLSWIIVSLATGFGFVCYFNDAFELTKNLTHLQINFTALGWILGIAGATYVMAGFAREHVCTYMCPYSRFQSAMFDLDTLIISYDTKRGEPRGKHKKGEDFANRGHCIDCKQCVVVCPTGIDIRNGLQMECIACGLCIDACDDIMTKIGLPKGLIRYDTERNLENPSQKNKFRFFKARTFYYLALISIACSLMIYSLIFKSDLDVNITPNRNPLFVKMSDGSVRNSYSLKIINKTHSDRVFTLKIINPAEASFKLQTISESDLSDIKISPEGSENFKIYTTLPNKILEKNKEGRILIEFLLEDKNSKEQQKLQTIFIFKQI